MSASFPRADARKAERRRHGVLRLNVVAGHVSRGFGTRVIIGGVEHARKEALWPALVPRGYADAFVSNRDVLELWQWMLRKDSIKQDCFLIGPPGPRRRRLALAWCELLGKEVEYLALSRDTTEADLKQRREITGGSLHWVDQPPVRAARAGRVLLLDGLEKAERNVLPTLNNLLENREMSLQDGTFLTAPDRFDSLGSSKRLVRVHEDFRVIALGLPVPAFPGFPLDPPLRSRFQARHVGPPRIAAQLAELKAAFPNVPEEVVEGLVAFSESIGQMVRKGSEVPGPRPWHIPEGTLTSTCSALSMLPAEHPARLLHRSYPYSLLPPETAKTCAEALTGVGLGGGLDAPLAYLLNDVQASAPDRPLSVRVVIAPAAGMAAPVVRVDLSAGSGTCTLQTPRNLVDTPTQYAVLTEAMESVAQGLNVCFVGAHGEGKTVLARRLAAMLGYPATEVHTLHLYKDMTARDLLLRRSTDDRGDTRWEPSPLLTAILDGGMAVLDGLQRLRPDTIAALQALCSDQELDLADGTRICRADRFAAACAAAGEGGDRLDGGRRLRPVHASFRLIALATPPGLKPSDQWLSAEVLPLFCWLPVPRLSTAERAEVLSARCPSPHLSAVLRLAVRLQASVPKGTESTHSGWTLSLRQLLRLGRRVSEHPGSLTADVKRVALVGFMNVAARTSFEAILQEEIGQSNQDVDEQKHIGVKIKNGILDIGGSQLPVAVDTDARLIPQTTFFDIPRHLLRLREIMRDLTLGEKHLLLIGNQGTGKNKLVDHLLQLLKWEREYIQLHRDTTVSALTVQATLVEGQVVWEDSPLVQAVQYGRTLVIDEADKAPLEVVCILKGLVEDGEMTLSDGRRILRDAASASEKVIPIHPDFKMFLLANRPGFPFQGNDLFRECGDVYAPHVIENPDRDSEVELLRSYAPDVDVSALQRMSSAFTELRQHVEDGLLAYPYSTRELVNVSRHLQRFPGQSVGDALRDILDFERYDQHALNTLREVLLRWGIPLDVSGSEDAVNVAVERRLPQPVLVERWLLSRVDRVPKISEVDVEVRNCTYMLDVKRGIKIEEIHEGRAARFTEEFNRFRLPLATSKYDTESVAEAVVLPGGGGLCALVERTATGSLSLILRDLDGQGTGCDRIDASFGLRAPLRHDTPVKMFILGPRSFGLAGERRMYTIELGVEPTASELTLPKSFFGPQSEKRGAEAPMWNTDFSSEGVVSVWVPGSDTVAVVHVASRKARRFMVPGLRTHTLWALGPEELVVRDADGSLVHLNVAFRSLDAHLSGVVVEAVGSRPVIVPTHVCGSRESLPGACATLTATDLLFATLAREARAGYKLRQQTDHFGKDVFSISAWPRDHEAKPLHHLLVPNSSTALAAVHPAGYAADGWALEVLDLEKGTIRVLDPARLGSPVAGEGAQEPPPITKLVSLQISGTRAVLVQSNGWVRVVETNAASLEEQRQQWTSMVGVKVAEDLQLRIVGEEGDGEEEGEEEDEAENDGIDEDDDEDVLQAAVEELDAAWRGLASSLADEATTALMAGTASTSEGVTARMEGSQRASARLSEGLPHRSAVNVESAVAAFARATENEIRAQTAASALAAARPSVLQKLVQQNSGRVGLGLSRLLERASRGSHALQAEAEIAAVESQVLQSQVLSGEQPRDTAHMGEAAARMSVSRTVAETFAGEAVESRIAKLADSAVQFAAQAVDAAQGGSGAAVSRARQIAAQSLLDAASGALKHEHRGPPSAGGDDPSSPFATLESLLSRTARAEQKLAGMLRDVSSDSSEVGAQERSEIEQTASAIVQAAQSAAQGMGSGRQSGSGKGGSGRGRGRGRGSGQGSGRGGRGSGSGGSKGQRTGRGTGSGSQLSSDQTGGYSEVMLQGEFSEEDERAADKVLRKAKAVTDRETTKRSLESLGSEEYDTALKIVERQIRELRVVLEQQEAKDREREWVTNQATGELDDARLVDGVTGEKLIYRRRKEPDVPMGHQHKPKRLSFVMDVSASMSRFNGEDGRLDRMLQAVAMIMESLEGFDHKYVWNLVGHSGNGADITFVDFRQAPRSRVERARVLGEMASSSAIAASGDSTLEAIEAAIKRVTAEDADDYLVFVVSDANLGGYGITPEMLRKALTADPKVSACALFIAERDAAEMLSTSLPGRGYVCLDVSQLPNILKEVFARSAVGF